MTTLAIVSHKYLLVGDNPNPLGFSESLDWLTHYSLQAKNDVSKA